MFALDANAWIHALKGIGNVKRKIMDIPPSQLAVPAVVIYELEIGTLKSANPPERRRDLDRLLNLLTTLPFDRKAASHAAQLRFTLEKTGRGIGPLDTLIAATALAHGATLVTHNWNEFSRVPGLQVEDWF